MRSGTGTKLARAGTFRAGMREETKADGAAQSLVSPCEPLWAELRCLAVGGARATEPMVTLQRVEVYKNGQ